MKGIIGPEIIKERIFIIRGERVMLDYDLAALYEVETKQLKRAVKRNRSRFPGDFMFELTEKEVQNLRCQIGTSSWGGRRYNPYAFTEQGIAMLATVLNSERAIKVNIAIMRVFVKIRAVLAAHKELAARLTELEKRMDKKDREIISLFEAIRRLMAPPPQKKKEPIGFRLNKK